MNNNELYYSSQCPSFKNCSASICPLDPLCEERVKLSKEPKCKARAITRFMIAKNSKLKYWGLKKGELRNTVDGINKYKIIYSYLKKKGRLAQARDNIKH